MQPTSAIIWEQFNEPLHQFICKKVNHDDHCNDILQDLYLKIYLNITKIEKAQNVRAYIFQMAHNAITDHYRKLSKAPKQENDDLITALEDRKEEKSDYELADCCLRPMIEALPDIYKEALIFTELEGYTQQQLADKLGISLPAAKSRVQRAREKLKQEILQCCNITFDKYGNILSCCESLTCNKTCC